MIDFPNSPTVGQITTAPNGTTWRWSGSAWLLGTAASAGGARGVVAYAEVTAIQAGIVGTLVDVTGLTVTFNAVPGRTYRVLASLEILSTVAGDTPQATINTVVGSATMTTARVAQLGTPNWSHQLTPVFVKTGLSGEVSYKVMAGRAAGTGSLTVEARTYRPAFILVEDITYDAGPGGGASDPTPAGYWKFNAGSIGNIGSTATILNCLDTVRDTTGMLNGATGDIVIARPGWYQVDAHLMCNYQGATPPSMVQVEAKCNNSTDSAQNIRQQFWAQANIVDFHVGAPMYYNAADKIRMNALQIGGANVIPYAGNSTAQCTSIAVAYIGP